MASWHSNQEWRSICMDMLRYALNSLAFKLPYDQFIFRNQRTKRCTMRRFTTPFTCSICKTEFCNPISLVKHVELEHSSALRLSTINITRTEHRTYGGLLIESIIVSEFKDSLRLETLKTVLKNIQTT